LVSENDRSKDLDTQQEHRLVRFKPRRFASWSETTFMLIAMTQKKDNSAAVRSAWDAYYAEYMEFHLKEWPNFHEHFAKNGATLDAKLVAAFVRQRADSSPTSSPLHSPSRLPNVIATPVLTSVFSK